MIKRRVPKMAFQLHNAEVPEPRQQMAFSVIQGGTPWETTVPLKRRIINLAGKLACVAAMLAFVSILFFLVEQILKAGLPWLSWHFFTNFSSRLVAKAGVKAALFGTVWLLGLLAVIAVPMGVGAAIYLHEIAEDTKIKRFLEFNIVNLAGVPSIVFGMLGLAVFVRFFALGHSLLAGAFTLSLLILPMIMVATRETLITVPKSIRFAAYSLGASKWQTVWGHIFPAALPGILTGVLLSLARAIGETAPLIVLGGLTFIAFVPNDPLDEFTTLPIQIFNWSMRPQESFRDLAGTAIIVLLGLLFGCHLIAMYIKKRQPCLPKQ